MRTVLHVEHLSKMYRLGQFSTGTLTRDIERWWALKRGKDDPFSRVGEGVVSKHHRQELWSLRDLSFDVEQGTSLGIIGKNGAGKSTLLKVLSRVTSPTSGIVKVKGRVASLLEVGTGFHPELTGRENIFLNGAILGMTRQEVRNNFDEIVAFAGVDNFVDTPVKRYSSGMYVRLAFAVAAHLDSEILVVDEVLAVGDASFQKKCLGKMDEVSKSQGRTILFVSHNMASVKSLCNKSVVLSNGQLLYSGDTDPGISAYLQSCREELDHGEKLLHFSPATGGLKSISFRKSDSSQADFLFGEKIEIDMSWSFKTDLPARTLSVRIHNMAGEFICGYNTLSDLLANKLDNSGTYEPTLTMEGGIAPGIYTVDVGSFIRPHTTEFTYKNIVTFEVLDIPNEEGFVPNIVGNPRFYTRSDWKFNN